MQTFFIEDKQVIDRWLYFCKRVMAHQIFTFHLSFQKYYKCLHKYVQNANQYQHVSIVPIQMIFVRPDAHRNSQMFQLGLRSLAMFSLTYASQCSHLPQSRVATHRHVAAPPAVVSVHTAVDHNASVMPHHLRVDKAGNWATFSWKTMTPIG